MDFSEEARALVVAPDAYDLGKELAQGSFGCVFKGVMKGTREAVAVKKLKALMSGTPEEEKFRREIEIQASCHHKFLLRLVGFVPSLEEPVLITKFISGGSLEDKLLETWKGKKRILGWSETRLACCLVGVAIGLDYLHSQGFMHRDIKPGNVLLGNPPPLPLICDFGSARGGDVGESHNGVGTFVYLAPEFIESQISSQKSDVYAFGMMSYIMFAGHPYVKMENGQAVALMKDAKAPGATMVPPIDFSRGISQGVRPERVATINDAWWEVISACWSQDPNNRPPFKDIIERISSDPNAFIPASARGKEPADFLKFVEENTK